MEAIQLITEKEHAEETELDTTSPVSTELLFSSQAREFLSRNSDWLRPIAILGPQKEGKSTLLNSLVGYKAFEPGAVNEFVCTTKAIDMIQFKDCLFLDTEGTENPNRDDRHFHNLFLVCFLASKVLVLLDTIQNLCRNSELLRSTLTRAFENSRGFDKASKRKLVIAVKCKSLNQANIDLIIKRINVYWNKSFQDESPQSLADFYEVHVVAVPFDEQRQEYMPEAVRSLWEIFESCPAQTQASFLVDLIDTLLPQLNSEVYLNLPEVERQASLKSLVTIKECFLRELWLVPDCPELALEFLKHSDRWRNEFKSRLAAVKLADHVTEKVIEEVFDQFEAIHLKAEDIAVRSEAEAFLAEQTRKAEDPEFASEVAEEAEQHFEARLSSTFARSSTVQKALCDFHAKLCEARARSRATLLKEGFCLRDLRLEEATEMLNKSPHDWERTLHECLSTLAVSDSLISRLKQEVGMVVETNILKAMEILNETVLYEFLEDKLNCLTCDVSEASRIVTGHWNATFEEKLKDIGHSESSSIWNTEAIQRGELDIQTQALRMLFTYCRADIEYCQFKLSVCSLLQGMFSSLRWKSELKVLNKELNTRLGLIGTTFLAGVRDAISHKQKLFLGLVKPELSRGRNRSIWALGLLLPAAGLGIASLFMGSSDGRDFYSAFASTEWLVNLSSRVVKVCQQLPEHSATLLQREFEELTEAYRSFFSSIGKSAGLSAMLTFDQNLLEALPEVFGEHDLEVNFKNLLKAVPP